MHDFMDETTEEKMKSWRVDLDMRKYPALTRREALINVCFKIMLAFDHVADFTNSMTYRTPIKRFDMTTTCHEVQRIWVKAIKSTT